MVQPGCVKITYGSVSWNSDNKIKDTGKDSGLNKLPFVPSFHSYALPCRVHGITLPESRDRKCIGPVFV